MNLCILRSGAYRETQKWGGIETEGGGRILIKTEGFLCEIHSKMLQKGGGAKDRRHHSPPLYAYDWDTDDKRDISMKDSLTLFLSLAALHKH